MCTGDVREISPRWQPITTDPEIPNLVSFEVAHPERQFHGKQSEFILRLDVSLGRLGFLFGNRLNCSIGGKGRRDLASSNE